MASTSTSAQAGNNQCGKKEMKNKRNVRGVAVKSRQKKELPPHWSAQEDAILLEYVSIHGPWDWKLISKQILGRSADGCRNRWWEQLFRDTNTHPFIKQKALFKMNNRVRHGKQFGRLPKQLPEEIASNFNSFKNGRRRKRKRSTSRRSASLNPVSSLPARNIQQPATAFRRQPSPPAPHPPPSPPPPPPSPLSQPLPPPTFIDFLGVGSV